MELSGLYRIDLTIRDMVLKFKDGSLKKYQTLHYKDYPEILKLIRELVLLVSFTQERRVFDFLADENMKCIRCGACCTVHKDILINLEDAKRIALHLKLEEEEFQYKYTVPSETWFEGDRYLKRGKDGSCIFLKSIEHGVRNCEIYSVRPDRCRLYEPHNSYFVCRASQSNMIKNIKRIILMPLSLKVESFSPSGMLKFFYSNYPYILNKVREITGELEKLELLKPPVSDFMAQGKCSSCAYCCIFAGDIPLTEEEQKRISEYLGLTPGEFKVYFTSSTGNWFEKEDIVLRKIINDPFRYNWCVFLEKKDGLFNCAVFPVRPAYCTGFSCVKLNEMIEGRKKSSQEGL